MAYNKRNYYKRIKHIIDVYNSVKHADVPDTAIVRNVFPKHNIHITYRQWMNIKGVVIPSPKSNQLSLF